MGTQAHPWLSMKTTMRCIRAQLGRHAASHPLKLIQVHAAAGDASCPHSHPLPWLQALLRAHFSLEINGIRSASRGRGRKGRSTIWAAVRAEEAVP